MYHDLLTTLMAEYSGTAAKNLVAHISRWHRIQASPMYREAAEWLNTTLQQWGIESTIERYPTREGTYAWGEPLFQEWWCDHATLHLIETDGTLRKLADYRETPLSLIPRSAPAEGDYDIITIEGGEHPADYDGLDIRGKLILTRNTPMSMYPLAIERFGAAGIIFDGMRSIPTICPPGDLQDDIQYASWWWWGGETRAFGFALSPRAGAELRRTIARRTQRGDAPPRLRAHIQSHFADGTIEAVTARIPGTNDDQILIVSHLCHPTPCANDNASGAATTMELARTLHTLISDGRLPQPQRSIRFLWIPEMTGSYLYLAAHENELPRTIAGINLDMVGEDQNQCGSSWLLVRPPDSLPSFVAPLLEAIREGFFGEAHTFSGQSDYPLFRHAVVPFSNGSDNYILSDPSVGIPTPMLIQWPDRFYHTTADTIDKVSPTALRQSGTLTGTYAYFIANAGTREATWLAHEMNARFEIRLIRKLQSAVSAALGGATPEGPPWEQRVAFRIEHQIAALQSLQRLAPDFDPLPWCHAAQTIGTTAWERVRDIIHNWHTPDRPPLPADLANRIPQRRHRGPLTLESHLRQRPPEEREDIAAYLQPHRQFLDLPADLALYWADGQRTLSTILDLVELETGRRYTTSLAAYFTILARLGLIDLREIK